MRSRGHRRSSRRGFTPLNRHEASSPWMSYGDLFAGLFMIFALMLLTALYFYQSGVDGVREILMVRAEVIDSISEAIEDTDNRVVAVTPEGVIQFADGLLFAYDSSELEPAGREQIALLTNEYLRVVFKNEQFARRLNRIVIEGHTDDIGGYFYNLNLSQARANAVMEVMIESADEAVRAQLQQLVTANGRSFSDLIYEDEEKSVVDRESSRRIEIRFELDDQAVLRELVETVFRNR